MELVWSVAKDAGPVAILLLAALLVVSTVCGVLWRKLSSLEGKLENAQRKLDASKDAQIAELKEMLETERLRS